MIRTIGRVLVQVGRGVLSVLMLIGYVIALLFVALLVLTFLIEGPAFMGW